MDIDISLMKGESNMCAVSDPNAFGHGKIIYRKETDFPDVLQYGGCSWYRTRFRYTYEETGMQNYLYETDDRNEDLRLYVDAAGHIWDEQERGIL